MIFDEVKVKTKRWGPKWQDKDGASRGRAQFEHGGTESKIIIKAYARHKCLA
jgi:hypothetical protein